MAMKLRIGLFVAAIAVMAVVSHFPVAQTLAANSMTEDKVVSMLKEINKIRKPLYIKLDCEKFVYPYLGRHDRAGYYIDLFAASGISAEVVRQNQDYYIAFEIFSQHLKKIPNSRFGALDVVVIQFLTTGKESSSTIRSCVAVLKASPHHL